MEMGTITIMDNNSYVVAARQLMDRGVLTLEQYAQVLRRATLRQ